MTLSTLIRASVAALALTAGVAESRELRFSTAASERTPWGQAVLDFQQRLADQSGGELTIKPFFNSSLGDEQEVTRKLVKGRLDAAIVSASPMALALPEFNLTAQPFSYESTAQRHCVEDGHFDEIFAERLEAAGLVPLGWVELGNNILFSTDEIHRPDDLKGVKLRTPATKSAVAFMESLGAAAVPSGVSDILPNLKTGAVQAASTVAIFGLATGVPDLAPHILRTNHVSSSGALVVSARTWDKLSAQEQTWMRTAAEQSVDALRPAVEKVEQGLLDKAVEGGAQLHELTAEERAEWSARAEAQRAAAVADAGPAAPEIWDALTKARADCLSN